MSGFTQDRCTCSVGKGRDPLGSECPLGEAPEIPFTLGPGKPSEVPSLVLHLWGACLTSRALSYPQAEPSRASSVLQGSGGSCGHEGERGREKARPAREAPLVFEEPGTVWYSPAHSFRGAL